MTERPLIDRYTKGVLTVIAACLVWNIVSGTSVGRALADSTYINGQVHVVVDSVSSYAFQYAGPLKVQVER
jgi:hypothetical protein